MLNAFLRGCIPRTLLAPAYSFCSKYAKWGLHFERAFCVLSRTGAPALRAPEAPGRLYPRYWQCVCLRSAAADCATSPLSPFQDQAIFGVSIAGSGEREIIGVQSRGRHLAPAQGLHFPSHSYNRRPQRARARSPSPPCTSLRLAQTRRTCYVSGARNLARASAGSAPLSAPRCPYKEVCDCTGTLHISDTFDDAALCCSTVCLAQIVAGSW
ncbi:hypothetical protein NDU88_004453 [Pleurodeles waltl]|uniref:Uncharacterized protein n=1 Tax=Pleurodeles waltl TaxID=8319 RepID=A0AAV7RI72_PLEWA|nr:hypothetical protein NDU88_004453 [Pleurodeles waltl]